MILIAALTIFLSCSQENKNKNKEYFALTLINSSAEYQQTTNQLTQILGAINPLGGQSGTRSVHNSNGISRNDNKKTATMTQNCMLGGTQSFNGTFTATPVNSNLIKFSLSNLTMTFNACKQRVAAIGSNGEATPTEIVIEGSILRNVESSQETTKNGDTTTVIMSGTESMKSSDYKVNGIASPEFDLIFKRDKSKFTIIQLSSTSFTGTLEENAVVTGTVGGKPVNQTIKFTANFNN